MIYHEDGITLYHGDCVAVMAGLPEASVDCVVTSPPYWGLRAYSGAQQSAWAPEGYGAEPTPELYVAHTVEVLRAIRRVLKPSGVVWWNVGDTYTSGGRTTQVVPTLRRSDNDAASGKQAHLNGLAMRAPVVPGLKPKDLVLIPFRVALAAQADGWWVRSDVIWAKPNPMPESVTDRPTKAHEYVFLLTKSERYFWDQDAVREPLAPSSVQRISQPSFDEQEGGSKDYANGINLSRSARGALVNLRKRYDRIGGANGASVRHSEGGMYETDEGGRNIRSVWTIPTQPSPLPHFAAFPDELAERCIKAGSSERGVCPMCLMPWVRDVERVPARSKACPKTQASHEARGGVGAPVGTVGKSGSGRIDGYSRTLGWSPSCDCDSGDCPCDPADPEPSVVLDPFAGTGTTLKVARGLGRKAIGIEISRDYCELAVQRLRYGTRGTLAVRQGQGTLWEGA